MLCNSIWFTFLRYCVSTQVPLLLLSFCIFYLVLPCTITFLGNFSIFLTVLTLCCEYTLSFCASFSYLSHHTVLFFEHSFFFPRSFSALFIFPNYSVNTLFLSHFFPFLLLQIVWRAWVLSRHSSFLLQPVNRVLYTLVIVSKFYLCRRLRMSSLHLLMTNPENQGKSPRREWNWNSRTWEHPLEVNRK